LRFLGSAPSRRQDDRVHDPRPRSITSTKNPLVQRFRAAAAGEEEFVVFAEGLRLVQEGVDAGAPVLAAMVSPRLREKALGETLKSKAKEFFDVTDEVLERASALDTHQGVAVLFAKRKWEDDDLLRGKQAPLVLCAAGVRDPGNLGALLRSSEAAGATGVITLKGGADPFRDKAVRGSMGSVFRLPIRHGLDAQGVIAFAKQHGLQIVTSEAGGDVDYTAVDMKRPTLLVLGAEANGVSPALAQAANVRASIPLTQPVESLNVAVAAGVLLYEARRQRK
jgi:TrmH family RNA methyltransferase